MELVKSFYRILIVQSPFSFFLLPGQCPHGLLSFTPTLTLLLFGNKMSSHQLFLVRLTCQNQQDSIWLPDDLQKTLEFIMVWFSWWMTLLLVPWQLIITMTTTGRNFERILKGGFPVPTILTFPYLFLLLISISFLFILVALYWWLFSPQLADKVICDLDSCFFLLWSMNKACAVWLSFGFVIGFETMFMGSIPYKRSSPKGILTIGPQHGGHIPSK